MTDKDKPRKERAKRTTMGFQLLEIVESDGKKQYTECCETRFKSLVEAEKFIKKNASQFAGKDLMIAHLKKEVKVSTEVTTVAKLTEVK